MEILVAVLAFVVVAAAVFAAFSLLDQRNSRARLLRDRLAAVQKSAEREPDEELELLRDEVLSDIPALDNLLRRSERVSNFQTMLSQADLKLRAGNMLFFSLGTGVATGFILLVASGFKILALVGALVGALMPYSYASFRRSRRFQKFEELFPQAIDTLARAVRAGHALTTALELISNEVGEPVASEFRGAEIRTSDAGCTHQSDRADAVSGRKILCYGGDVAARNGRQSGRNLR